MAIFKNNLEKSIFSAVAYCDIFDYPLTAGEIWKWLFRDEIWGSSLFNVQKELEESENFKSLLGSRRGFYFLKGREATIELRQIRYSLAERKFKKALRVVRFLRFAPGIRMTAVCNSLAWSNASEESDIDFFIVTASNKIWTARFWTAGLLTLFGLRPTKNKTRDKICLSFFVDEDNLNLEKIAIDQPDIYLIHWITQLAPIYDRGGVYEKFLKANKWIKKYLPNSFGNEVGERRKVPSAGLPQKHASQDTLPYIESESPRALPRADRINSIENSFDQSALRKVFSADTSSAQRRKTAERFFRWVQLKVMPDKLKEMANKDTRIIVSDGVLKFHDGDRRKEYKRRWEDKMVKLLNG